MTDAKVENSPFSIIYFSDFRLQIEIKWHNPDWGSTSNQECKIFFEQSNQWEERKSNQSIGSLKKKKNDTICFECLICGGNTVHCKREGEDERKGERGGEGER